MKRMLLIILLAILLAILATVLAYAALPPNPLDVAFRSDDEKEVIEAITNSPEFKEAVREALAAKRKREEDRKTKRVGPAPAQAARIKFIEVLTREKK